MQRQNVTEVKKPKRFRNLFALTVFGLVIFGFGWSVGSGRINIAMLNKNSLQTQNANLPENLDYASTDDVYDVIRQDFDGELKVDELTAGLKKGLANATGDPYTEYFTDEEAKEFDDELNGEFSGIGAELTKEGDQIIVVAPISGYPADEAGIKPKDAIIAIDDKSTYGLSVSEAVTKIRGETGTSVTLTVVRDGKSKDYTIVREDITIPSVETEIKPGNIGYIKISRFAEDTVQLAEQAASEFKSKNVKGVIIDVRGNPGGLLESSVDVSSLWLNEGDQVVVEKRGQEVIKTHLASGDSTLSGIPTIVLIDEGSASASEILAGALKDNDAATLMGTDSFGKGSVQQLTPIISGGVLKITVARWFTPDGRNIDQEGISPDIKIEISDKDINKDRDTQLQAALKKL